MRLFLLRVRGPLSFAASVLMLTVPAAGQTPDPATQPPATQPPATATASRRRRRRPRNRRRRRLRRAEDSRSLFAPSANMFQLSGRWSSISGDPARWQRYQDLRDGLLFTEGRVLRETPDWNGSLSADNVGWRDQRYAGNYERIGFLTIDGLWDEIPQFYSVDTRTAFTEAGDGVLLLDDAAQRAANHNAYRPSRRNSICANAATSARFASAPRRRRNSTCMAASRRRSIRASCRGGRASGSATTTRWRCPIGPARTTWTWGWNGRTAVRCFAPPTTGRGSTTSRIR